tara:strand:+ start:3831 stop:3956 length:126 start_codon:yes stop_codon:yes gene_type:complete
MGISAPHSNHLLGKRSESDLLVVIFFPAKALIKLGFFKKIF